MASVIDDIKQGKGYILGVLAFATAVGTFLTQVMHFRTEPTLIAISGFALTILFIGWLVQQSENRQEQSLKAHQSESAEMIMCCKKDLKYLKQMAIESQRSTTRIEMNDMIARHPDNHDTILQYAERYFITLNGDWVETSAFFEWVESENEAGRRVHVPPQLLANVNAKRDIENYTR